MPSVEILVGTIASGKSTYCKKRAKEGAIIVNDDAIVCSLHAGIYTLYDKSIKALYKSLESHIVNTAILIGRDVIVDRGVNLTPRSRRRFIGIATSLDVDCIAIVFPFCSPAIHAADRFKDDSRGLSYRAWEKVVEAHIEKYKRPTMDEGFTEIFDYGENCR